MTGTGVLRSRILTLTFLLLSTALSTWLNEWRPCYIMRFLLLLFFLLLLWSRTEAHHSNSKAGHVFIKWWLSFSYWCLYMAGHLLWTECCISPKFICWSICPQCDGIWRRAFGRWFGMRAGPWFDGISALIRRDTKSSLARSLPPPLRRGYVRTQQEGKPWRGLSPETDHAGLWSQTSSLQICEKINVCCLNHLFYGIFYSSQSRRIAPRPQAHHVTLNWCSVSMLFRLPLSPAVIPTHNRIGCLYACSITKFKLLVGVGTTWDIFLSAFVYPIQSHTLRRRVF